MNDHYKEILSIIRATRAISLPSWGSAEVDSYKDGSGTDVVTKLDYQIEEYLQKEFARIEPSIGFVGEEFGGDRDAKKFWLVDPIDGTGQYIRGLPLSTTMVALIEDTQVIFSAIYDFVQDNMYSAQLGKGAFCNDEPIHVSDRNISEAYISLETSLREQSHVDTFLKMQRKAKLTATLCSGWEYAMVACGKWDGRICLAPFGKDYDFAPGSLLVSEAGGIVANIGTHSYEYTNRDFIATNKKIYEVLTTGPDALFPVV